MDRKDIEDFGFTFIGKSIDKWFEKIGFFDIGSWTSYRIILHYGIDDNRLFISAKDGENDEVLFNGIIKTKDEFLVLLKQLGIDG